MTGALPLILLGAGGHAKVIADLASAQDRTVMGHVSPGVPIGSPVGQSEIIGNDLDELSDQYMDYEFFVAIGDNRIRLRELFRLERAGVQITTLIHPRAYVSKDVQVGSGSVIMAGAVVQAGTRIGRACVINTGATVDHDCHVEDGAFIAPGATICGTVTIGQLSFVGAGANVAPNKTLGNNVFIGIGVSVIDNIPTNSRMVPKRA
ncbi:acetyltransferase [Roseibium denhamense]|uniref:Sugar O-acyltransferase, sialic acid O-acetyltransferase NeuD family n=1 Tax=Roseibium denhamense TaxID=76305 RepID=A0ABY1PNJ2_9HYPH|nr:acetyltransferase [Roseibium denhamense]MTI03969.1 acetyltransferase [Roseibium denhamense]SMP37168.1 sugar O-acyltransferase, sialic acid O-acetyltransferase NeuD family [Roseibium denhamense]